MIFSLLFGLAALAQSDLAVWEFQSAFGPSSRNERILLKSNGDVTFELRIGPQSKKYSLLKLSPGSVREVERWAKKIRKSDLPDKDPEAPECAGSPSRLVAVFKNGQEIPIYQNVNCIELQNPSETANRFLMLFESWDLLAEALRK